MGEAGIVERSAKLGTPVALDVLDQDEDVGLEVEEGGDDGRWDGPRPGLVADAPRSGGRR